MKSGKMFVNVFAGFKNHEFNHVVFNSYTDTVMVNFYPIVNAFFGAFQFSQFGNILFASRFFNVGNGLLNLFFQRLVFDLFDVVQKRGLKIGIHFRNAFITSSRLTLGVCKPFSINDTKCASASSDASMVWADTPIRRAKSMINRVSDLLRGWIRTASIYQILITAKISINYQKSKRNIFHNRANVSKYQKVLRRLLVAKI